MFTHHPLSLASAPQLFHTCITVHSVKHQYARVIRDHLRKGERICETGGGTHSKNTYYNQLSQQDQTSHIHAKGGKKKWELRHNRQGHLLAKGGKKEEK